MTFAAMAILENVRIMKPYNHEIYSAKLYNAPSTKYNIENLNWGFRMEIPIHFTANMLRGYFP